MAQQQPETPGIAAVKQPKPTAIEPSNSDARAEQALAEARKLPSGPERSEALKKASALRIASGFVLPAAATALAISIMP